MTTAVLYGGPVDGREYPFRELPRIIYVPLWGSGLHLETHVYEHVVDGREKVRYRYAGVEHK